LRTVGSCPARHGHPAATQLVSTPAPKLNTPFQAPDAVASAYLGPDTLGSLQSAAMELPVGAGSSIALSVHLASALQAGSMANHHPGRPV